MAAKKKKREAPGTIAAQNRKARHDYFIEDSIEAGLMLMGSEVKSLREGRGNIGDSYAEVKDGEVWLVNAHIPEYKPAKHFSHTPTRPRKMLLKSKEIARLSNAVNRKGMTLVPLSIYFNDRGIAKVDLGLARGKKGYDKRESSKNRDWKLQQARVMRAKG
ncbi:SsrA-binding protein SmpB [Magnetospira sp. QH-2]|uniref:SsrA-binding protein SmpB n=1 Tax=Magnetospira sp. (strain QH-2) TaxID=1288970 RepID=UPI0003E812B6|nr:SsrA-binding protein SmpB [Magnetospira sp. QH-2]CCQ73477.1 Trans-translation protein, binds tmRNA and tRNA (SsrA-binding protein) [Magnetospira sp. QH-2]